MARNTSKPVVDERGEVPVPVSVVAKQSGTVASSHRVARFRGRPMIELTVPYPHFVPLRKEMFDQLAYPILGGLSRSKMSDVFSYLANTAEDLTANEDLILFGVPVDRAQIEADTDLEELMVNRPRIWNTKTLEWEFDTNVETVWRSPYSPVVAETPERLPFIMDLAGQDEGLYDDIMQSMAPLVMDRKPDGVVWWVGDGANGKSTLMDAIYRIFPGQLSSINVKRLTDGRDTPSLNGTLANVVKESSEGRIDDTEIYKSIGTHENFRVHKFHSQDDLEIRGNLHHIFSGNSIPVFNDKGHSARRRTFIVPFMQTFESDPSFEQRTFTRDFFGRLIVEMTRYAQIIKQQNYRYHWSMATLAAKAEYDSTTNSVEEYARTIIAEGVVAFDSFNPVRVDYENWCADNGYVPLGVGHIRRTFQAIGFSRVTTREGDDTFKRYRLPGIQAAELQSIGMGRPGLFTVPGFDVKTRVEVTIPDTPPEVPSDNLVRDWSK